MGSANGFVFGDLLFVFGTSPGSDYDGPADHETFVVNLAAEKHVWTRLPSFSAVRDPAYFVDGDGKLWTAGGMIPKYCPTCSYPTRQCFSLDLRKAGQIAWKEEAKLPFAARELSAVAYQNGIMLVAGVGGGELDAHHLAYIAFLKSGTGWSPLDRLTGRPKPLPKEESNDNEDEEKSQVTADESILLQHRPLINASAIEIAL